MSPFPDSVLLTGATGLVGRAVLERLLRHRPDAHGFVVVRDLDAWKAESARVRWLRDRVTPLEGDLTLDGLGLGGTIRRALANRVDVVVHAAADTVFSRPLEEARAVNTRGTERVLELARALPGLTRYVHVSTAFVAGRRVGRVAERDHGPSLGFVNGYERSKYEAEAAVRATGLPWVIVRPSAIVCDDPSGSVSQYNSVHRALRLYHGGLASMMPGAPENPVDVVPADYVADCVARATRARGIDGRTFHACSGDAAPGLGTLLDAAYGVWCESREWKRRSIPRPALTDLQTYRLFERAVDDTGDARLASITRSLAHFVPQLALPKRFDTESMDALLGRTAPDPLSYWPRMVRRLVESRWAAGARRAA